MFIPIVFLVCAVNFIVDPANIYKGQRYEEQMASILLSGKNIANIADHNEMLLQKSYIEGMTSGRDAVALGSSKLLQMDSTFFEDRTFANNSISGVTIDDFMVIYYMYRKNGHVPKKIVVGLEPGLLNKKGGNLQYLSVPEDYLEMSRFFKIPLTSTDKTLIKLKNLDKYVQLFSPSYFQSSVKSILSHQSESSYFVTSDDALDVNIKRFDGSLAINRSVRERSRDEINHQAQLYKSEETDRIDVVQKLKLEKFVKTLKDDNVEIVFLIIPYQVKTYEMLVGEKHLSILKTSQNYFQQLAQNNDIKIIGSFNPSDCDLSEEDFYDGVHIKPTALKKIFNN